MYITCTVYVCLFELQLHLFVCGVQWSVMVMRECVVTESTKFSLKLNMVLNLGIGCPQSALNPNVSRGTWS